MKKKPDLNISCKDDFILTTDFNAGVDKEEIENKANGWKFPSLGVWGNTHAIW